MAKRCITITGGMLIDVPGECDSCREQTMYICEHNRYESRKSVKYRCLKCLLECDQLNHAYSFVEDIFYLQSWYGDVFSRYYRNEYY